MKIEGSCHCGAVRFRGETHTPVPYQRCYCSICRKTAGGGGYAINIMAEADSLQVEGMDQVRQYHAHLPDPTRPGEVIVSQSARHFCGNCGSALWISDPRWPDWIYPFASAIDTALPVPPERVHMMTEFAAPWVEIRRGQWEIHVRGYPKESIEDWHRNRQLYVPD